MTITASGRAALILTTGIWICLGAPSQAAAATDSATAPAAAKHHHLKKYAHHRSGKVADKSATDKKTTDAAADDSDNSAAIQSSQMPASVANANAQLVSTDTPAGNAQAMTDRANNIVQAATGNPADAQAAAAAPVVAPDQLNDVDRALQAATPAAAPVALASAEEPAAATPPPAAAASNSSESSTWDQTSLIGKIFIGFGALLTMASAARMFMA
jgi:hypothetical protein